ncbi:neuron-specific vesicular protein calcyon isoform X1 [Echinops telfairi]|uniref:Neuron-specific vesicular protein calcyon isoform X1 n=5 Tax=Echinops telfairi TaxID=9371 RepID=A0AC55D5T4_ECHTE|nr:neuron-specific vesicular protein calcyon isoform X1 [Echinops telfairi]XP_045147108.1 neuron-specific vesicular protein calcyon isoform X1 [Echinops telfairi]XP_045147109.1 neuron-specific vesicular protein calcyon isoform X1 [Echinops telfairi]XP_045147110.1 neuron-specific vesicular protein calcyon isoform X1 [Echinops telfairi]XP_045147112.1 neuron-specific vesicular protein calcyon isoform X1 [Echinops telfairi]
MVKLGCSFSGKVGKGPGDGAATDSVPLISPLDVSQLQPSFSDQVVIKTKMEYQLSSPEQAKKFSDLEAQPLNGSHSEEGRKQLPTARMLAFALALMGCVLIMYKAIWYDQFTCPDGFLLRHKICTPLTLEMYYTEMDPERHRSILAAIGAYPLGRKHGTEMPSAWAESYRAAIAKEDPKGPTQVGARLGGLEPPGKHYAKGEKEEAHKAEAHKAVENSAPVSPQ